MDFHVSGIFVLGNAPWLIRSKPFSSGMVKCNHAFIEVLFSAPNPKMSMSVKLIGVSNLNSL
jgi:hypothetical protein